VAPDVSKFPFFLDCLIVNIEGTEIVSKCGNSLQTDRQFRYCCDDDDDDDDDNNAKVQNIRHAQ